MKLNLKEDLYPLLTNDNDNMGHGACMLHDMLAFLHGTWYAYMVHGTWSWYITA